MLNNIEFITSVFSSDKIIKNDLNKIVLVGKSNVGKSSFINSLANQKHLAKVGKTPGKTKSLNYYLVNNNYYIVDLPGYGFSTMTNTEKENTSELINTFIKTDNSIKHMFLLVDIRHNATKDDKIMYEYLLSTNIPFSIIATKADKLSKSKIDEGLLNITKSLFAKETIIPFSSETKLNIAIIENILKEKANLSII